MTMEESWNEISHMRPAHLGRISQDVSIARSLHALELVVCNTELWDILLARCIRQ